MTQQGALRRILVLGSQARSLINFRGRLIADLAALGHHVTAAAPGLSRTVAMPHGARGVDIDVPRQGMNPAEDLAFAARVRRLLRQERPDLLITSTVKPNIWGAFAARLEGVESIAMVTGLGYAFTPPANASAKQRAASAAATRLYRAATRFNSRVVFQNPDDADEFVRSGCLADPSKIVMTAGSGVDTHAFAPTALPAAPSVLMVSRLLGNKGVREYADAVRVVKQRRPHARFRLAGGTDGGPDAIAPGEIETLSRAGVEHLGDLNDVRGAIAAANVCVLPSYREGTPRAVLEAMSMGRAIVTSDAPGCRETVREGHNGYLVPVRDSRTLAERIERLVVDAETRGRMGAASRDLALERFDVEQVNARLINDLGLAA